MSDIASRVKAIIVEKLGVDENEVTPEASFTNDLGADSLDLVELIMGIEEEFDIDIPNAAAENIVTVADAVEQIKNAFFRICACSVAALFLIILDHLCFVTLQE